MAGSLSRWAFLEGDEGIEGECEECETQEHFEDWNEVIHLSYID